MEKAPQIKDLDLRSESVPMDRALGIRLNVEQDTVNFAITNRKQPDSRKGAFFSITTAYGPVGFASPLLLPGRETNQE